MSGWPHISESVHKSRRDRLCCLCSCPIRAGRTYVKRFGFNDGEAVSMAMHPECEAMTREWDEMDWETFSPGVADEWPRYDESGSVIKQAEATEQR